MHRGAWWYERTLPTGDSACHGVASGTTTATLSLTVATSYTYTAYDKTGCNSADVIGSLTFSTPAYGSRKPSEDFTLNSANANPYSMWSDGTTMWVLDQSGDHIYAYKMSDQSRDTTKEFSQTLLRTGNSNSNPRGIWSDGTTMWVADRFDDKLYAYTMSTRTRVTGKEFDLHSSNTSPRGIWSDGTTVWATSWDQRQVYAYTLATGARDTTKEFTTHTDNTHPIHIWSDGTTMWAGDWNDGKVYAYTLATGARVTGKEFDAVTNASTVRVTGVWSDGATMWLAHEPDSGADQLFGYWAHPPTKRLTASGISATGATLNVHWHTDDWWYTRTTPTGYTTCHSVSSGTTTATLSTLTGSTSYTYKAYDKTGCNSADEIASVTFTTP